MNDSEKPLPQEPQSSSVLNAKNRAEEQPDLHKQNAPVTAEPSAVVDKAKYLVGWAENDPENPKNWNTSYKSWLTFQLGMLALAASLASSIIAPAEDAISSEFGISREAVVLSISLYILGFAVGPLMWAPVSEVRV